MRVGLLWYDPDPKKAAQTKIDEAAARYEERFGVSPNTCHVNPGQVVAHPGMHVVADRWVRAFNFWVGVDEDLAAAQANAQRATRKTVREKRSA